MWCILCFFFVASKVDGTSKALELVGGNALPIQGAELHIPDFAPPSVSFWVKVNALGNLAGIEFASGDDTSMVRKNCVYKIVFF